jgi:hypothetical protein
LRDQHRAAIDAANSARVDMLTCLVATQRRLALGSILAEENRLGAMLLRFRMSFDVKSLYSC